MAPDELKVYLCRRGFHQFFPMRGLAGISLEADAVTCYLSERLISAAV